MRIFTLVVLLTSLAVASAAERKLYTISWIDPVRWANGLYLAPEFIEDTHIYVRYWDDTNGYSDWNYLGSQSLQGGDHKYYFNSEYDGFMCFAAQTQTSNGLVSELSNEKPCVLSRCH